MLQNEHCSTFEYNLIVPLKGNDQLLFHLMISVASSNRESCFVCVIRRGVRDQAPNTMDMDTQPQGQQAAVPVFQPQVTPHTDAHCNTSQKDLGSEVGCRLR